ncbi:MAG TPA: hypothetical protein VGC24_01560, partial [Burkholderiaceae bacterium]
LRRQRPWAWLFLAAYIGIALVLHLIPMTIGDNMAQDRFITLPLAFVCIAFVCFPWKTLVADRLGLRATARMASTVLLGCWLALLAITTMSLIPLWKDELVLWSWEHIRHPDADVVQQHYLQATLQFDRTDLAEKEINRILEKDGHLKAVNQFFYSQLLMMKGDPEAIPYLEGVISIFPRNANGGIDDDKKLPEFASSSLKTYARVKLMFDGDVVTAMRFINAADKLTPKNQKASVTYTKAAILYAMDRFDEADNIIAEEEKEFHTRQKDAARAMRLDLKFYCKRQAEKNDNSTSDICLRLKERSFF